MSDIIKQNAVFSLLSNTIRPDGMVSATALTTAYTRTTGVVRDSYDWLSTKSAKASIAYLAARLGVESSELVKVVRGGNAGGTWIHPKLVPILAAWISTEFQFAVIDLVGAALNPPVAPALPSRELAVETAVAIDKIQDLLGKSNPRVAQILIDCAMSDVLESSRKALPEFPNDKWHPIVSIADSMGIKTNDSTRVKLGNHVGKMGFERVREERLCNGELREIWCYRDCEETRRAITDWASSVE